MVHPASTVTVMSPAACSSTRCRPSVEMIKSARWGGLPHSSLVPPPRGTTASPSAAAAASARANAASSAGSATHFGLTPATVSAPAPGRACEVSKTRRNSMRAGIVLDKRVRKLYFLENSNRSGQVTEINQLHDDLRFVRDAVARGDSPQRGPAAIYVVWAVYVLVGYTLLDFYPTAAGWFFLAGG